MKKKFVASHELLGIEFAGIGMSCCDAHKTKHIHLQHQQKKHFAIKECTCCTSQCT